MHLCVTANDEDLECATRLLVSLVQSDARNGSNPPLLTTVKCAPDDGPVVFVQSPAEVNAHGHGNEWSLVRAAAARVGFAIAVCRATGGVHPFLVLETHDFSHANNPLLMGEIIDPSVERGYNGGKMLPLSVYRGAYMHRIWPHGHAPRGADPVRHEPAHEAYQQGMGTKADAPADPAKAWRPVLAKSPGGVAAAGIVEHVHGEGKSDPAAFVAEVQEVGQRASAADRLDLHDGAKGIVKLSELFGQDDPSGHAEIAEMLESGTGDGHDKLFSSCLAMGQCCPTLVPAVVRAAMVAHCGDRMHPGDLIHLEGLLRSAEWVRSWVAEAPPAPSLVEEIGEVEHRDRHATRRPHPNNSLSTFGRAPSLPPGFPAPGCSGGCSTP